MIEDIAGDDDDVDLLAASDLGHLGEDFTRLIDSRQTGQRLADVPVACVQESHRSNRSNGSPPLPASAASLTRVAQAGNGNVTSSGIGRCGCCSSIVPGFNSAARWRAVSVRNPYSARCDSAGSSRPTTRIAAFDTIRRSTSLAVC